MRSNNGSNETIIADEAADEPWDTRRVLLAETGPDSAVACYRTGPLADEPMQAQCRALHAAGTTLSAGDALDLGAAGGLALAGLTDGMAVVCRQDPPYAVFRSGSNESNETSNEVPSNPACTRCRLLSTSGQTEVSSGLHSPRTNLGTCTGAGSQTLS